MLVYLRYQDPSLSRGKGNAVWGFLLFVGVFGLWGGGCGVWRMSVKEVFI